MPSSQWRRLLTRDFPSSSRWRRALWIMICSIVLPLATHSAQEEVLRNLLHRRSSSFWNRCQRHSLHASSQQPPQSYLGSRITRRIPTPDRVARWCHPRSSVQCHPASSSTHPLLLQNSHSKTMRRAREIRLHCTVGAGPACYRACRDAAAQWEFASYKNKYGVVRDATLCSPPRMVTYASLLPGGSLYIVQPVSVLYTLWDQRDAAGGLSTATAMGTRPGHWLRGEERVTVSLRPSQTVEVEIVSYSRPGSLVGRSVFWALRPWQTAFFRAQLAALQRVGEAAEKDDNADAAWMAL